MWHSWDLEAGRQHTPFSLSALACREISRNISLSHRIPVNLVQISYFGFSLKTSN